MCVCVIKKYRPVKSSNLGGEYRPIRRKLLANRIISVAGNFSDDNDDDYQLSIVNVNF